MSPEPQLPAIYDNCHNLVTAFEHLAGAHGYVAMIKNFKDTKGFIYIACDCSSIE
jgi:hypothetical protein